MPIPGLPIGVALSGAGSTLANLQARAASGELPITIVAVASSSPTAGGLAHAARAGIPHQVFRRHEAADDAGYSQAIFAFFAAHGARLVVLAGFLKRLVIPAAWRGRVINIHPALLPAHGGRGMYGDHVHAAVLASGDTTTGCTVHVVDDEYDHGKILFQVRVPVRAGDDVPALRERVQAAERAAYPQVLALIASGELALPLT